MKEVTEGKVVIDFGSEKAATHFKKWLDGQGEQDYWLWMSYREEKDQDIITATQFIYDSSNIIKVKLGRLHKD